ncbi:MAG: amino acid adenylation domain-containing protein [Candidatus Hydrogenedentes bacterium]|nr:amino acid adenylation domain-containing protein [Candidatus Hydrogenedentota bacterium]
MPENQEGIPIVKQIFESPPEQRRGLIETHLRERVAQALNTDPGAVPVDRNVIELGLDSLMIMELVSGLAQDFQLSFYAREIFERPSIDAMADYIAGELNGNGQEGGGAQAGTAEFVNPFAAGNAAEVPVPEGDTRNPPAVFLLSSPRSGSTLLRVMLAGHSELFCPPELHLLPFRAMKERDEKLGASYLGEGLQRTLMELHGINADAAGRHVTEWLERDEPIQRVYGRLQRLAAPRMLVDKSPTYASDRATLDRAEALFDAPKYLFLVRHPYAVIESIVRNRMNRLLGADGVDPFVFAEQVWTASHANTLDFLEGIPAERHCTVRYEDLVREPERVLGEVCAFLGVPFQEALLTPYDGPRMTDGVHAKSMAIGDPGFLKHDSIDGSLGEVWKTIRLPKPLGHAAREVAARLDYDLPASTPGATGPSQGSGAGEVAESGDREEAGTDGTQAVSLAEMSARSGLTNAQLAIWFGQKLRPDVPQYNMGGLVRLPETMRPELVEETCRLLIDRTDVLRTVVDEVEGIPQPRVLTAMPFTLERMDFREAAAPEQALEEWARERTLRRFDLTQRLFDLVLARLGDTDWVLFVNQHHLICDGLSADLLMARFVELYGYVARGRGQDAPPYPSYEQYARLERRQRESGAFADEIAYWRAKLAEPFEPIAFYGQTPEKRDTRLERMTCDLGTARTERLIALARDSRFECKTIDAALFNMLTAALFAYVHRVSGNERVAIGTMQHNRHPESRDVIGMFVGAAPLRLAIEPDETLRSLCGKVRAESLEIRRHSRGVVMARQQDRAYDVLVNYQVGEVGDSAEAPLSAKWIPTGCGVESLALQILNFRGTGAIRLHFDLHADLFDEELRARVLEHFLAVLDAFIADPEQRVGDVELLTDEERHLLLDAFNRTAAPYPEGCTACELVEGEARKHPDRVAIRFDGQSVTYAELEARANQLAHCLQRRGIGPERIVAICVERSVEMVVGVLGVMKAGGAYLPLDPTYPLDRLAFMFNDSGAALLLTQSHLKNKYAGADVPTLCLDTDWGEVAAESTAPAANAARADSLAYVFYTSGSTGRPKGVLIEHRGLCNLMAYQQRTCQRLEQERVLQFASFSFDMSVWDVFMALGGGNTLCLAAQDVLTSPSLLSAFIRDEDITFATFPPTMLRLLQAEELPGLRTVVSGGERCPADVVNAWAPGRLFLNAYGPTEATVATTIAVCEAPCNENPPIGRPLANMRVYILDRYGNPAPLGVPGELYVGGVGVGRGYLNRPALTEAHFVPDPFGGGGGGRLYRTGDLARYRRDGNVEFLGRTDDQVKIYGNRVELGEIEATLELHSKVNAAVVVARSEADGTQRLVAYVVPESGATVSADELRDYLNARLAAYMVPTQYAVVDALPVSPGGKVDRRALPEPGRLGDEAGAGGRAQPRTDTERRLCRIWARLLGLQTVGIHDNFFDLGGDSLRSIQIADQARREGIEFTPGMLYERPTVAGLASVASISSPSAAAAGDAVSPESLLNAASPEDGVPVVVPIKPGGRKRPFFCVAPAGGVVFPYINLVPYLDPDRPFYGLQDPGLAKGHKPYGTVEELARHYVKAMRAAQPEGPYLLGGWSFGGTVAFEMARQLCEEGEEPGLVALMDTGGMVPGGWNRFRFRELGEVALGFIKYTTWALRNAGPYVRDAVYVVATSARRRKKEHAEKPSISEFFGWVWLDAVRRYSLKHADVAEVVPEESKLLSVRQPAAYPILRVNNANFRALRRYTPGVYPGRVTLFRAENQPFRKRTERDPSLGWGQLAEGGVDVRIVPGNHVVMFRKPFIEQLGTGLRACLDEADPGPGDD